MLSRVERVFLGLSMVGIAALAILVTASVAGRALFGVSVPDDVVLIQETMVVVIILPLAFVAAERGHIAVTLFTDWLPRRGRMALNALGSAIGFVLFGVLALAGWDGLAYAVSEGSYYDGEFFLPEWPGKAAYFAGLAVFALRLAVLLIADIVAIAKGAPDAR